LATPEKVAAKEVKAKPVPTTVYELQAQEDKSEFEWVSIPAKDDRGFEHPDMRLNRLVFEAGKKHFMHPVVADTIKKRLEIFRQTVLRSLLSNRDAKSMAKFPETN
jgi:hypothetical protein